jgi:hypothetical protein
MHQSSTTGGGGGGGIAGTTPTAKSQKKLDEWDVVTIKGLSHLTDTNKVQSFWKTTQGVTNKKVIRQELDKGMELWSKVTGAEIEQGRYFPEDIISCIQKVDFVPGEPVPTFATADKGLGPLPCRPWTSDAMEADQKKERAAEATAATRTYNEVLQLEARAPMNPPANLLELRLMIATFCALLWTLFGDKCDLYIRCFEIYRKLKEKYIALQSAYLTPLRCREITWAIIVDSRRYLSERMHPSDLMVASPAFPRSFLGTVLVNIQEMNEVKRGHMPISWQESTMMCGPPPQFAAGQHQSFLSAGPPTPAQHGTIYGNQQLPPQLPPQLHPPAAPTLGTHPPVVGSGNPQDPVAHVHPAVKAVFQPYWTKYRYNIQLTDIMNAAGLEWKHMPYLTYLKDMKKDRSMLCYKHVCGICPNKKCPCGKVGGHLAYWDVQKEFQGLFTELARKLKPGVDYLVKNGLSQQLGSPNKKQKTGSK